MKIHAFWHAGKEYPRPALAQLRKLIAAAAQNACPGLERTSVTFLSPAKMAEVNEAFLGHHGSTDVICFDYRTDDMPLDGDEDEPEVEIFICPAVAAREAAKRSLPYSSEVALYLIHGFLHAGGFDDLQPKLKRKMRAAERRVRSSLPAGLDMIFPEPVPEKKK